MHQHKNNNRTLQIKKIATAVKIFRRSHYYILLVSAAIDIICPRAFVLILVVVNMWKNSNVRRAYRSRGQNRPK